MGDNNLEERCWVQCDRCQQWRNLPGCTTEEYERVQALKLWTCNMNIWDPMRAACSQPEEVVVDAAAALQTAVVTRTTESRNLLPNNAQPSGRQVIGSRGKRNNDGGRGVSGIPREKQKANQKALDREREAVEKRGGKLLGTSIRHQGVQSKDKIDNGNCRSNNNSVKPVLRNDAELMVLEDGQEGEAPAAVEAKEGVAVTEQDDEDRPTCHRGRVSRLAQQTQM